jgi:malonate-semialdehyde dehydrogenase (acetylating) / methylmalonate-semialdehyde dehydrogenase
VQGGREVSERLLNHPDVKAIAFVGSTPVASSVYEKGCSAGKRVMALGGAKNHLIVMPDSELEGRNGAINAIIGSGFGCAGQRCLAGSVVVAVGDKTRQDEVVASVLNAAKAIKMGSGLDPTATMGPLGNEESVKRVASWIDKGISEGAKVLLDGRTFPKPEGFADGCFLGPSVLELPETVTPQTVPSIGQEEVFGPLLVIIRVTSLEQAIAFSNASRFGNSASIFTNDAAAVRIFKHKIQAGMLGINLGVPAPIALPYSFRGTKQSAFGSHGAYGMDSIDFFTQKKAISERYSGSTMAKLGWV